MSKGSNTRGKAFEKEWWTGMQIACRNRKGKVRVHRFYDLHDYVGKHCPRCRRSLEVCGSCGARLPIAKAQPPKQPSDFETVWRGRAILQELKSSHNPIWYDCRFVKPHQIESLVNNKTAGGEGVIVFCNRSNPRDIKVYALDIEDYLALAGGHKYRTIKWELIEERSFYTPDRKRTSEKNPQTYYDHEAFCDAIDHKTSLIQPYICIETPGVLDENRCNKVNIEIRRG